MIKILNKLRPISSLPLYSPTYFGEKNKKSERDPGDDVGIFGDSRTYNQVVLDVVFCKWFKDGLHHPRNKSDSNRTKKQIEE